jgi:glycosyltransferase involved in cell wall biosynthesis
VRALPPYGRAHLARRQRALLDAGCTIAVSTHVANVLCEFIPALTPEVIPNFITLDGEFVEQEEPRDERLVLYAGKLEPHKGADLLPDALAAAPGARLVVAGSGPLDGFVARECAARGVPVELRGELPHDEVLALKRCAAAQIFPARWEEPLTRTLLEAGACGLPAVALATGGTPDIIADGQNGRLVADMDAFAAALHELLDDPAQRARLAAGAQATARECFSAGVVAAQVEGLYAAVLAGGAA